MRTGKAEQKEDWFAVAGPTLDDLYFDAGSEPNSLDPFIVQDESPRNSSTAEKRDHLRGEPGGLFPVRRVPRSVVDGESRARNRAQQCLALLATPVRILAAGNDERLRLDASQVSHGRVGNKCLDHVTPDASGKL